MITTHKPTARIFEQLFAEDNVWDTYQLWRNQNERLYFGFLLNHPVSRGYVLADRNFRLRFFTSYIEGVGVDDPPYLRSLGPDRRKEIRTKSLDFGFFIDRWDVSIEGIFKIPPVDGFPLNKESVPERERNDPFWPTRFEEFQQTGLV